MTPARHAAALGLLIASVVCDERVAAQESATSDVRAVVSVPSANVRSQPSVTATLVTRLVRGDSVRVVESRPGGWTRVRKDAREGWTREAFLQRVAARVAPAASAAVASTPPASTAPARVPDSTSAPQPSPARGPATESEPDIDPRLAGRAGARRSGRSTVPASHDASRLGVMLGLATGPYQTFSLNGPAARVYLRQPVSASPLAGRLDLEVSRMTARDLDPAFYRVVDARVTGGMEYGVPLNPQVELAVVGSVGVARQTTELSIDLGAPGNAPSNVSYKQSDWSLAYDVGIGAKLGRRFHAAFHFFSSDGAPFRLYLGVRL